MLSTHFLGCRYKEVTLLGQNIDAYGRDLPGLAEDGSGRRRWTFTDLLRYVHDVPGIERIRFTTSHVRNMESGDEGPFTVSNLTGREYVQGISSLCPNWWLRRLHGAWLRYKRLKSLKGTLHGA